MFDLLIDRSPAAYVAWAATAEEEPPVPVEPVAQTLARLLVEPSKACAADQGWDTAVSFAISGA